MAKTATKKSKPVKAEKTKDGVIGPKNRQNYANKKAQSMPKFSKGGMVGKRGC